MVDVNEIYEQIRQAKRKLDAIGQPPLTLIKVGSMERFRRELEKRSATALEDRGRADPFPGYFGGVPVDETNMLPPNFVSLHRGNVLVGLIDLDKGLGSQN